MKLAVEIKNTKKAIALASFLKANGYHVLSDDIPIADDDWSVSGRSASDEEQERLAMMMEQESDGEDLDIVFDRLFKKFSVCSI